MLCAMTSDAVNTFQTTKLKPNPDYLAPDGSEIRLLPTMEGGGLCHCTLPAGKTSAPVMHRNVEEIWYIVEGQGEVWRKIGETEAPVPVDIGTSLTIPPHTAFQFRNTGAGPLCILIATIPAWPGSEEAVEAVGLWQPTVERNKVEADEDRSEPS